VTARIAAAALPQGRAIGLLATSGTVHSGLYQRALERLGRCALVPEAEEQAQVMEGIAAVKAGDRAEACSSLLPVANRLIARGASGLVLGCTEIPLALSEDALAAPLFDSLEQLAEAVLVRAGRR
jgi:aspartate racemase